MKKILLISSALAILSMGSYSCKSKSGDGAAANVKDSSGMANNAAADSWYKFSSVDGKYSISFPAKPEEKTDTGKTQTGIPFTIHLASYSVSNDEAYLSSYIDMHSIYPDGKSMQLILDDSRNGAANSMGATTVTTTDSSFTGDTPFIQFTFSSATFTGKDRIYMIDKMQYSVVSINAASKGVSAGADKFIGSFKRN